jgi:pilus assembly protein Flp/PilA
MTLIAYAKNLMFRFADDQDGASLVEYALLISLIAAVAFIAVTTFGSSLSTKYSDIANSMP